MYLASQCTTETINHAMVRVRACVWLSTCQRRRRACMHACNACGSAARAAQARCAVQPLGVHARALPTLHPAFVPYPQPASAQVIVGWNKTTGVGTTGSYWIIRNSWCVGSLVG